MLGGGPSAAEFVAGGGLAGLAFARYDARRFSTSASHARRDIVFAMARVKHELADDLEAAGLLRKVGPDRLFATLPTAVAAFQASAVTD